MRGLKVRGSYSTKEEAEARAKKLQTLDSNFNVFVGEVGKWLPWDPCADGVQSEVFQNTQLNDMMEKYEENNVNRDIFYEEQKRDKIKAAKEEVLKKKREEAEKVAAEKAAAEKAAAEKAAEIEDTPTEEATEAVTEEVYNGNPVSEEATEESTKTVTEEANEEAVEEVVHEVSSDIKKSLESTDPWLANKLKEKSS